MQSEQQNITAPFQQMTGQCKVEPDSGEPRTARPECVGCHDDTKQLEEPRAQSRLLAVPPARICTTMPPLRRTSCVCRSVITLHSTMCEILASLRALIWPGCKPASCERARGHDIAVLISLKCNFHRKIHFSPARVGTFPQIPVQACLLLASNFQHLRLSRGARRTHSHGMPHGAHLRDPIAVTTA